MCNVLDFFYYHLVMETSGKEMGEENATKTKRLVHNLFKVWFILLIQFLLNTETHTHTFNTNKHVYMNEIGCE